MEKEANKDATREGGGFFVGELGGGGDAADGVAIAADTLRVARGDLSQVLFKSESVGVTIDWRGRGGPPSALRTDAMIAGRVKN